MKSTWLDVLKDWAEGGGAGGLDFQGVPVPLPVQTLLTAAFNAIAVENLAEKISGLLNDSYGPEASDELVLWRRLTKVSEEAGEVQSALRGWTGENPRKGVTHSRDDVVLELLDTAGAAFGSIAHLAQDGDETILAQFRERLSFVADRLQDAANPSPTS